MGGISSEAGGWAGAWGVWVAKQPGGQGFSSAGGACRHGETRAPWRQAPCSRTACYCGGWLACGLWGAEAAQLQSALSNSSAQKHSWQPASLRGLGGGSSSLGLGASLRRHGQRPKARRRVVTMTHGSAHELSQLHAPDVHCTAPAPPQGIHVRQPDPGLDPEGRDQGGDPGWVGEVQGGWGRCRVGGRGSQWVQECFRHGMLERPGAEGSPGHARCL